MQFSPIARDPRFERLFTYLVAQTSQANRYSQPTGSTGTSRQSPALFLVALQVLFAVNRAVNFLPYATSFELADTSVSSGHWSVR